MRDNYIAEANKFMYDDNYITEAKVKVGGKEYASKKDAGLALAAQNKTAEQIEKITGLSLAGAKWCIAQTKKGSATKEPTKTEPAKKSVSTNDAEKVKTARAKQAGMSAKHQHLQSNPMEQIKKHEAEVKTRIKAYANSKKTDAAYDKIAKSLPSSVPADMFGAAGDKDSLKDLIQRRRNAVESMIEYAEDGNLKQVAGYERSIAKLNNMIAAVSKKSK